MKKNINERVGLSGFPRSQGLYNPKFEKDSCGFEFIANINNIPKHEIVHQALEIVQNLDHRGAIGADPLAGDGCLLYTSPSPRDGLLSRMPSSA